MNLALVAALLCAFVDWYAVARHIKSLEYVFKPATLGFVIVGTLWLMAGAHDAWQARWFLAGFVFALAGDVFLMLPNSTRWFIFGLGAFLLAHVFYIIGLNPTLSPPSAVIIFVLSAVVVGGILARVVTSLRAAKHTGLIPPVLLYGLAMTLTVFSAWSTLVRPEWSDMRRVLVISGATLLFISDALLAWNRFVQPFAAARLGVIITYHLGQIALAASIAM